MVLEKDGKDERQKLVSVSNLDASADARSSSGGSINIKDTTQNFLDQAADDMVNSELIKKEMMRSSRYSIMAGEHGLTVNQGALAILSTCVGGGIVSLPLAMFNLGLPLAIFLQVLVIGATHLSSYMYLNLRDIVPDRPDSLYEIGYMILGRPSIFVLSSIMIINSFGLCMIYFIVFGDTFVQLVGSFTGEELDEVWYTSRWCYSVPLAVVLLPIVLKKELAELAWISYVLFGSLTLFVVANLVQLCFDPHFDPLGIDTDIFVPKIKW